jgi:hypothetical protein
MLFHSTSPMPHQRDQRTKKNHGTVRTLPLDTRQSVAASAVMLSILLGPIGSAGAADKWEYLSRHNFRHTDLNGRWTPFSAEQAGRWLIRYRDILGKEFDPHEAAKQAEAVQLTLALIETEPHETHCDAGCVEVWRRSPQVSLARMTNPEGVTYCGTRGPDARDPENSVMLCVTKPADKRRPVTFWAAIGVDVEAWDVARDEPL